MLVAPPTDGPPYAALDSRRSAGLLALEKMDVQVWLERREVRASLWQELQQLRSELAAAHEARRQAE